MGSIDKDGREVLDSTPLALPIGFERPMSLEEKIALRVRMEVASQRLGEAGYETLEESDDFDVGDDYEPNSPYEEHFDHLNRYEEEIAKPRRARKNNFKEETPKPRGEPTKDEPSGGSEKVPDPAASGNNDAQ